MKKTIITALWSLLLVSCLTAPAFAQELLLGGQVVGVQISMKGVLVAGLSQVETAEGSCAPAKDAGVQQGDVILRAGGQTVSKAADVISAVEQAGGAAVELELERGEKTMRLSVQPARSAEGQWLLGMWLRDGVTGIGTVTFQDPESGVYGALGHSVCDSDSGILLPLEQGSICDAQIIGINPGAAGSPGELNGCADLGKALGSIELNTDCGIFGESYGALGSRKIESGAMATGPAIMISTLSGRVTGEYQVEINRIYRDGGGEHALISVTDPELLEKTGGIVQGMSGSPLIQNGKLVGAVTHVFVNDPSRGYAVSIDDMLRAAGIQDKAA